MPQSTMSYQSEYGQDTRQTQSFGAYNHSMMYNVPQSNAPNTVYDASQQFPSRQPAAMQMMSADVAAPYFPNEAANNGTGQGMHPQPAAPSSTSTVYQQSPSEQRAILQNYSGGMSSMSGMAQTSQSDQLVEEADIQGSVAPQSGEAYVQYQATLKEIFQGIHKGVLSNASASLLSVSDWLLSKVVDLGKLRHPWYNETGFLTVGEGLVQDDANLHAERIKMWNDFNNAWLGILQRQKEMMESSLALQRGQSVISKDGLLKMGKELIRLCDSIERHGLVDYQYGVWEEQIEGGKLAIYSRTSCSALN